LRHALVNPRIAVFIATVADLLSHRWR
jgi:hypothetical protein